MYKMGDGLALLNKPKITLNLKSDMQTQIRQYSNESNYQKANQNILVSTIYAFNSLQPKEALKHFVYLQLPTQALRMIRASSQDSWTQCEEYRIYE